MDENYKADISREGLASAMDMSPDHFSRMFKKHKGMTIGDYINELRINESVKRLLNTNENVITIALNVGFESVRSFNRIFHQIMGQTPSQFRLENKN